MSSPQDDRGPRVNHAIRVREVRVIADDGAQLGVIPTHEAIRVASEKGLDLVEVQPQLKPPICKIMDYGKFKYQQKRKTAEQRRNQKVVEIKQVQLGPNIADNDFEWKTNRVREFIEVDGNKCRVSVEFSGREMAHVDLGHTILGRVVELLKDCATVEHPPKLEGKSMAMVLQPLSKKSKPAAPKQPAVQTVTTMPTKAPVETPVKEPV